MRVSHRLDFSNGKTPLAVEQDLLRALPEELVINTNHWLVLFGRYICKAQHPECDRCPVYAYCHALDKIPQGKDDEK
jgi:endonuclease-3